MDTKETILEEGIEFNRRDIFGDGMEHTYNCQCHDGVAICTLCDDFDTTAPKKIKVTYPTLDEILLDDDDIDQILNYRGLYDLQANDIHYGDVMVTFGEIAEILEK